MKLEEVAKIKVGVLASRENKEYGENSYRLFSLKNYEEECEFDLLKTNKDFEDRLAKKGDLIFRLLYPNKIICVDKKIANTLIPSQFCIITPIKMDETVLKWFLESEWGQEQIDSKVTGSVMKSMSITNLKKIEIPNISPKRQNEMKSLINLWEQEKSITNKILQKRAQLCNHYLKKIVKEGVKNG